MTPEGCLRKFVCGPGRQGAGDDLLAHCRDRVGVLAECTAQREGTGDALCQVRAARGARSPL